MDVIALEARRFDHDAPVEQHRNGDQHEEREAFLRQHEQPVWSTRQPPVERECREDTTCQDLDAADREYDKSPEDERVQRAGHRIAQDFSLCDAYREKVPDALPDVIPSGLVLSDSEEPVEPLRAEREARERYYQDEEKEHIGRCHGLKL